MIYKSLFLCACLAPGVAGAGELEVLDDSDLSLVTAQKGLSLFVDVDWRAMAYQWADTNGVPVAIKAGYLSRAALIVGNLGTSGSAGVQICNEAVGVAACTRTPEGLSLVVDAGATAVATSATIRIQGNLAAAANKIRVSLDKVTLANATGAISAPIIDLVNNYFELSKPANPLFEVELGGEAVNGHLLALKNADFRYVNFGEVRLCDKSDATCATQKLSFEFSIGDSATGNNGLNLTGMTADINASGLVVNNFSSLTSANVMFNNIKAGTSATTMGGVGVTGLNLSNLSLTFAGKN